MEMKEETYEMKLRCTNCGNKFSIDVPVGTKVNDEFFRGAYIDSSSFPIERIKCSSCGCSTCHKMF